MSLIIPKLTAATAIWLASSGLVFAQSTTPTLEWLSESVEQVRVKESTKNGTITRNPATEAISVTSLDSVKLDALGVLPAKTTGLPSDFWGDSKTNVLTKLLRPHESSTLPEITILTHRILLTELDVPIGHQSDGELLLARVDHLLAAGALDQAEALLERADVNTPELFRRWFDIGLLTGRAQSACSAMMHDPGLAPTLPARIFCLSRTGDWNAAALTLTTGVTLGQIPATQEALLERFLDPDLFEGEPEPPQNKPLTALEFTMREALSLTRSGSKLPLAFLGNDLLGYTGWRSQIEASERLVRAQAIPTANLFRVYGEGKASASGGVWRRVRAVNRLESALSSGQSDRVGPALIEAYNAMAEGHLEFALSDWFLTRVVDYDFDKVANKIRFQLALLHRKNAEMAQLVRSASSDPFLLAIATDSLETVRVTKPDQRAVANAFLESPIDSNLLQDVAEGRKGEAVLRALHLLNSGGLENPASLELALSVLLAADLRPAALRIAIQALILNRQAGL